MYLNYNGILLDCPALHFIARSKPFKEYELFSPIFLIIKKLVDKAKPLVVV